MSLKKPRAKWPLPEIIDPPSRRCVTLHIPDEPHHVAAFYGALLSLASGAQWADDPDHKAKDVAKVWWDVFNSLEACTDCGASGGDDMQWRQNPDNCNQFQYSVDCVHWTTIFDIEQCVADAIARQTGQQTGGGQPPVGGCKSWQYNLPGNGQQILGVVVTEGDTITITGMTGGCGDGSGNWYCPAGTPYFLGDCGSTLTYNGSDPLTTAPHMSIIGRIGTTSPVYIAPVAGVFTIPPGHFNEQFVFMVNDNSLSDNAGSYQFSAEYCSVGTAQWCYKFDFAASDGGWVPATVYSGTPGDYVALSGWANGDFQSPAGNYYRGLILDLTGFTGTFTSIVMTYDRVDGGLDAGNTSAAIGMGSSAGTLMNKNFTEATSGTDLVLAYNNPAGIALTSLEAYIFSSYTGSGAFGGSVLLKSIELHGTGTNPFGTDNC